MERDSILKAHIGGEEPFWAAAWRGSTWAEGLRDVFNYRINNSQQPRAAEVLNIILPALMQYSGQMNMRIP